MKETKLIATFKLPIVIAGPRHCSGACEQMGWDAFRERQACAASRMSELLLDTRRGFYLRTAACRKAAP
jgi:hypothetical protein